MKDYVASKHECHMKRQTGVQMNLGVERALIPFFLMFTNVVVFRCLKPN